MTKRIKITNISSGTHGLRLMLQTGAYGTFALKPKQFRQITEEQFYDLFVSDKAFELGILSFDDKNITEEMRLELGLPLLDEEDGKEESEDLSLINLTDDKIKDIYKGNMGSFNKFIKQAKDINEKSKLIFYKRLFEVANKMDDLNQKKAMAIEELTGIEFKNNKEEK